MIPKNNINYNKAQLFLLCTLLLTGTLHAQIPEYQPGDTVNHRLRDTGSFFDRAILPRENQDQFNDGIEEDESSTDDIEYRQAAFCVKSTFSRTIDSKSKPNFDINLAVQYLRKMIGLSLDANDKNLLNNVKFIISNNESKINDFFVSTLSSWYQDNKKSLKLKNLASDNVLPTFIHEFNQIVEEKHRVRYEVYEGKRYLLSDSSIEKFDTRPDDSNLKGPSFHEFYQSLKRERERTDPFSSVNATLRERVESFSALTAETSTSVLKNNIILNDLALKKFAILKDMFTPERLKTWFTFQDDSELKFNNEGIEIDYKKLNSSFINPFGTELNNDQWRAILESALAYSYPECFMIDGIDMSAYDQVRLASAGGIQASSPSEGYSPSPSDGRRSPNTAPTGKLKVLNKKISYKDLKTALSELYGKITSGQIITDFKRSSIDAQDFADEQIQTPSYSETLEYWVASEILGSNFSTSNLVSQNATRFLNYAIGLLSSGESAYGLLKRNIDFYKNKTLEQKNKWDFIASLIITKKVNEGNKDFNPKEIMYEILDVTAQDIPPLERDVLSILENNNKDIDLTPDDYNNKEKVRSAIKTLIKEDRLVDALMAGYAFGDNVQAISLDESDKKLFTEALNSVQTALQNKTGNHKNVEHLRGNLANIFKVESLKLDNIDDVKKAIKGIAAYFSKTDLNALDSSKDFDGLKKTFLEAKKAIKEIEKCKSDGKKIIEALEKEGAEDKTLKDGLKKALDLLNLLDGTLKKDGFGFSTEDPFGLIKGNIDNLEIKEKTVKSLLEGFANAQKALEQKYGATGTDELIDKISKQNQKKEDDKKGNGETQNPGSLSSEVKTELDRIMQNPSNLSDEDKTALEKLKKGEKVNYKEAKILHKKVKAIFLPASFVNAAQSAEGIKNLSFSQKFWALVSISLAGSENASVKPYFEALKTSIPSYTYYMILRPFSWIASCFTWGLDEKENICVDFLPKLPATTATTTAATTAAATTAPAKK